MRLPEYTAKVRPGVVQPVDQDEAAAAAPGRALASVGAGLQGLASSIHREAEEEKRKEEEREWLYAATNTDAWSAEATRKHQEEIRNARTRPRPTGGAQGQAPVPPGVISDEYVKGFESQVKAIRDGLSTEELKARYDAWVTGRREQFLGSVLGAEEKETQEERLLAVQRANELAFDKVLGSKTVEGVGDGLAAIDDAWKSAAAFGYMSREVIEDNASKMKSAAISQSIRNLADSGEAGSLALAKQIFDRHRDVLKNYPKALDLTDAENALRVGSRDRAAIDTAISVLDSVAEEMKIPLGEPSRSIHADWAAVSVVSQRRLDELLSSGAIDAETHKSARTEIEHRILVLDQASAEQQGNAQDEIKRVFLESGGTLGPSDMPRSLREAAGPGFAEAFIRSYRQANRKSWEDLTPDQARRVFEYHQMSSADKLRAWPTMQRYLFTLGLPVDQIARFAEEISSIRDAAAKPTKDDKPPTDPLKIAETLYLQQHNLTSAGQLATREDFLKLQSYLEVMHDRLAEYPVEKRTHDIVAELHDRAMEIGYYKNFATGEQTDEKVSFRLQPPAGARWVQSNVRLVQDGEEYEREPVEGEDAYPTASLYGDTPASVSSADLEVLRQSLKMPEWSSGDAIWARFVNERKGYVSVLQQFVETGTPEQQRVARKYLLDGGFAAKEKKE